MNLTISKRVAQFYKREMSLDDGDILTLFVRVGGVGSGGFSVGIVKGKPDIDYNEIIVESIHFCVTVEDSWYFNGMTIDYDEDLSQFIFKNPTIDDVTNPT